MTTLFELQKLGSSADYNPIMARAYAGADMGEAPKFDGTDMWPVTAESLIDSNDITSAKESFSMGYVVGNTWVSGKGDLSISLSPDGSSPPLMLHDAVITMTFDESHKHAANGTISGVISTDEVAASFSQLAKTFDPSFCDPQNPTLSSILAQIAQASDIMKDGTQDPSKPCDGISIGLGFEASVVQLGGVATPVPPPDDPCAQQ
jgi:hypothetical protein